MSLPEARKRIPFSNGTEFEAWQGVWCDHCIYDHGMHDGTSHGCPLLTDILAMDQKIEGFESLPIEMVPEPDDGNHAIPSRMICTKFEGCHRCDPNNPDPHAETREAVVKKVRGYWIYQFIARR